MHMWVVKTGQKHPALQIDDPGIVIFIAFNTLVIPHINNHSLLNCDCLGTTICIINGMDSSVISYGVSGYRV